MVLSRRRITLDVPPQLPALICDGLIGEFDRLDPPQDQLAIGLANTQRSHPCHHRIFSRA